MFHNKFRILEYKLFFTMKFSKTSKSLFCLELINVDWFKSGVAQNIIVIFVAQWISIRLEVKWYNLIL